MGSQPNKALLIVDASPPIIDRLIDSLKDHDTIKNISTAADYEEAVGILGENNIDIAMVDIQLMGKNGIDLLKFIVTKYPDIKVVMLSNLSSDYYIKLCYSIGAKHFLDKSKDFELIPGLLASM